MRKLKLPGRDASRPRLGDQDIKIVKEIGIPKLEEYAREIVENKLRDPVDSRKKVPTAGNPIYKAMHACNVASRVDLSRSHRMRAGKELGERQMDSIANMLTRWIVREYNFYHEEKKEQQHNLSDFR